ncbi:RNA 2',3'-cyclic phosphodiesterase [Cellulosimicrobium cellulans]|uniref:RNA 2',3'-cyclic phosphodiesterase n=1 Tax=Cellulosimicrobium cellulans TaxID=1710 RepID=UPI001964FD3F|nr:RNA 2',3'-cyclic phosphodiesterase [Cellulosimicrobium cellulans]MBN0041562.1 RNA 2',3'-cyclic phosphodiesterase [Cellulosimicrobium cellulans]
MSLFAALRPSAAALDHLALALASAHAQEVRRPDGAPLVRWTPPELWHVTVSFFGSVPDGAVPDLAAALARVAREAPRLSLRLRGAGVFDRRVLWVGVGGLGADALPGLSTAAAEAAGEVGVHVDRRPRQRAHLTVARAGAGARQARRRTRSAGRGPGAGVADLVASDPLAGPAAALSVYAGPDWTAHELLLLESAPGDLPGDTSGRRVYRTLESFPLAGAATHG